jgi:urease accessory protein
MMIYLTQRLDHAHPITASVTLPIDVRVKSRARVALNDGREAGLMLPRGLLLRGGDLLTTDDGSEVIEVIAAPESVSVVRCADPFLLARACYHLGNRHVPLQIMPGELRYHHDHVLDDMLRQFGLEVTYASLPFEPEAGATPAMPTAILTLIHIKDPSCASIYRCYCWPFPFPRSRIPATAPTASRPVFPSADRARSPADADRRRRALGAERPQTPAAVCHPRDDACRRHCGQPARRL